MKKSKPRQFKRLETDSSEEDLNASNPVQIFSKNTYDLQQELEKKEEEIQKLKQILLQTQEKLQSSLINSSFPETSLKDSSLDGLAETLPRPKKKFVEKFEDLVFVSKKNNLLLDEFEEVDYSKHEEPLKEKNSSQIKDFYKSGKLLNENGSSIEGSVDKDLAENLEKLLNSSRDMNESKSIEKNNQFIVISPKASEISKCPSEKSKVLYKNIEMLENQGSGDSFADLKSPKNESSSSNSMRYTPTLKNNEITENSEKPERNDKASGKTPSLDDFDLFLSKSYEDSQSKLKKIMPSGNNSPDFYPNSNLSPIRSLKSTQYRKEQATNTDINDLPLELREAAISESKIEKIDKELRESSVFMERSLNTKSKNSRNSSFPWIQTPKLEDLQPEEIENPIKGQDIPQIKKTKNKTTRNNTEKPDFQSPFKKQKKTRRPSERPEKSQKIDRKNDTMPINRIINSTSRNQRLPNPDKTCHLSTPVNPNKSSRNLPPPNSRLSHKLNKSGKSSNSKYCRNQDKKYSSKRSRHKSHNSKVINDSTLDEIIFDEDQDMISWHSLMHKFRTNPGIVEKLMKVNIRPVSRDAIVRPKSSSRVSRATSKATSNANPSSNALSEYRPVSASTISKKVKDPDWSFSVLSNYVSQNKKKFNFFNDFLVLSGQEIEEFLIAVEGNRMNITDLKKVFGRINKTLNILKNELLLPEFWIAIPSFSEDSVIQGLHKCAKLIKARNLTVKIIDLIQKREKILSNLIINKNLTNLKELEKINEELMQVLVFWRYMELPFSNFIYMGEDYYVKIQTDNISVSAIFPDFNVDNIYRPPQISDSFNFDI